MATNSLHHHSIIPRRRVDSHPPSLPSTFFLKTTTPINNPTISISFSTPISSSTATTSTSQSAGTALDLLETHLASQDFRQADDETRRLLIALAGESAVKRGYVFFSEVQFIEISDLQSIDNLWKKYSNDKFGYSVQRKIWRKSNQDFTKLFIKLGWMKKLDTEVEQYNYRAFPTEFIWELGDDSPEGHLPLTNALRGTQLLKCILNHPAFEIVGEADEEESGEFDGNFGGILSKPRNNSTGFKTDYSF